VKIRTQDARQYLEYGEIYTEYSHDGKGATVYVRSRFHNGALFVGVYEDMARAKGVLYEVDLAYQTGQRVFYMPAE
jgi:hypothetical protein